MRTPLTLTRNRLRDLKKNNLHLKKIKITDNATPTSLPCPYRQHAIETVDSHCSLHLGPQHDTSANRIA